MLLILSVAAVSQLGSVSRSESSVLQVTPDISLEEKSDCVTEFYSEIRANYGDCMYYSNFTTCANNSGPNTGCAPQQRVSSFRCKTGETTLQKNRTTCTPKKEFLITINRGGSPVKKRIDYSEWGPCVQEEKDGCLIITCVSYYDGAHNGQFTDCSGGKSCQRFEFCKESVRAYYKNSREDFAERDPTFYLEKLQFKEVGP